MDLESLKKLYAADMVQTQTTYTHWYGYNQRLKNYLFIASVVAGVGTLLAAATFPEPALKIGAAIFGALSTIAAALQRFSRVGAKAEFYGGQVQAVHVLWLELQRVKTEPELHRNIDKYAAILLAEGKLSREGDDAKTLGDEIAELKKKLEKSDQNSPEHPPKSDP